MSARKIRSLSAPKTGIDPQRFRDALARLPNLPAQIFRMHAREGQDYSQIAVQLRISISQVERHLAAALAQLAKALEEDSGDAQ